MRQHGTTLVRDLRRLLPDRPLRSDEALAVAEQQAATLLDRLCITQPPVDVSLLCELPRLLVVSDEVLAKRELSSETAWQRGRWVVRINPADTLSRRRSSLAHEFKHILDRPGEGRAYAALGNGDSLARSEQVEAIADHFAASLLMPTAWVTCAVERGYRDLHPLAALFVVSPIAMSKRLHSMGATLYPPTHEPASRGLFRSGPMVRLSISRPDT